MLQVLKNAFRGRDIWREMQMKVESGQKNLMCKREGLKNTV